MMIIGERYCNSKEASGFTDLLPVPSCLPSNTI